MSNNESLLWDVKYKKRGEYKNLEDFFCYTRNNPTIAHLESYLFEGAKVLEIGSGTGEMISYLSSRHNIEAYGVDFSFESVRISNKLKAKFNIEVLFRQADILRLPFVDNHLDFIYGDQVIGHIKKPSEALLEIHRVLKPGGVCLLSASNKLRPDGWDLYKKIAKDHQGYTQESFYPWSLIENLQLHGFRFVRGYGDLLLLMRNVYQIKENFFCLNKRDKSKKSYKHNDPKEITFLRKIYNVIDNHFPWWAKISIGAIVKKI